MKEFDMKELHYTARDGAELSVLYYESQTEGAPLIVEIHGGGYYSNHHVDDYRLCVQMQEMTGMNVASLDYRLAPKFPFPTPINDCYDALQALLADQTLSFDRSKIFAWGHSAGANAVVALAQMQDGFSGLVLDYPWLDADVRHRRYVLGSFFNFYLRCMRNKYLQRKEDRKNPLASPVFMTEEAITKLPETLIVSCGIDTLKQDSFRFEQLLHRAGVVCRHEHFQKAEHGFLEFVSGGRNRCSLIRGRKRRDDQAECYRLAMILIASFFTERERKKII